MSTTPTETTPAPGFSRPRKIRRAAALVAGALIGTILTFAAASPASALPAFTGGYLYPVDNTTVTAGAHFGAQGSGCNPNTGYVSGLRHLGADLPRPKGTTVHAIADGVIVSLSSTNWDREGNRALGIKHTNSDGTTFVALYGHIQPSVTAGSVTRGQAIGTIGSYSRGSHLHLGVAPGGLPTTNQGAISCSTSSTNGFVDPIAYLKNHTPKGVSTTGTFDPCAYRGWVVGANGLAAKYLVQDNCKRAHIPTGGDYESIVANVGTGRVKTFGSVTELNRIPDSGRTVRTRRVDQPAISGPTTWIRYVSGVGSRAVNGDYHWTTHAAGRPLTNEGRWDLTVTAPGRYRVKCFIPNRTDAWAGVTYRVHNGSTLAFTSSFRQADKIGWTHLGDLNVTNGAVKIRLRDNEGSGPYAARFAYDACEAVPIG